MKGTLTMKKRGALTMSTITTSKPVLSESNIDKQRARYLRRLREAIDNAKVGSVFMRSVFASLVDVTTAAVRVVRITTNFLWFSNGERMRKDTGKVYGSRSWEPAVAVCYQPV